MKISRLCIIFLGLFTLTLLSVACGGGSTTTSIGPNLTSGTSLTTTITTTSSPPTTTNATANQTNITITKTASLVPATPAVTENKPTNYRIVDLFVPEFTMPDNLFPILMTITNNGSNQTRCDIPIIFRDTKEETNVIAHMINITLDGGETREILVEGFSLKEAFYEVHVGNKIRPIRTS